MSREDAIIIDTPNVGKEALVLRNYRNDNVSTQQAFSNLIGRAQSIAENAYKAQVRNAEHKGEPIPPAPHFSKMSTADKLEVLQYSDYELEGLELQMRLKAYDMVAAGD